MITISQMSLKKEIVMIINETKQVLLGIDDDGIATVTINRPETHNAFNQEVIAELTTAFKKVHANAAVRAMILCSNGKSFSAGADLNWMRDMVGYSLQENQADAAKLAEMFYTLYHLNKPTIARVQGAAFGGAVGLIACCDIAIGSRMSKFCLSEVKLGLIPATISPYVVKAIGARMAKRYFVSAEVFSSRRARRIGLLSETVSETELDSSIYDITAQIIKNGPQAVSDAKALVDLVDNQPITPALIEKTSMLIAQTRVSPEGQEGLSAFLEKRKPEWLK